MRKNLKNTLNNNLIEVITTIKRNISLTALIIVIALLIVGFIIDFTPSSSTLKTTKATTTDQLGREVVTTTYTTKAGKVTVASEKGYATHRQTKENGKVVLEEYLDAAGKTVLLSSGYSAIERVYTDGLNTTITYLGPDHQPVVINNGYSSIHRSYTDQRLADTDTYWIGDQQVTRTQGYTSLHRIYGDGEDKKRIVRQEYRNINGDLVLNSSGYAYLTRSYNSLGKVEKERYFGTDDEPAALSLGHCGYDRTYDEEGRITQTTYLGPDQKPINTKNGYATVKNIYGGEEEVKHLYFDSSGVATTGTHGEYGYTTADDGKKILLDSSGEPLHRIDIFLNSNPIAVLILGAVFTILALIVPGKARILFLLFYLGFVYMMTLAWREGIDVVKVELFWSYRQFMSNASLRREIINNVFLFVPLGVITTRLLGGNGRVLLAVLICLALSVVIELLQLRMLQGTFEWDDMISNGVGGLIGSAIATILPTHDSTTQTQEE